LELAIQGLRVNGLRLENRGVDPDVPVAPGEIYTDHDAQLLRAEQILAHTSQPVVPSQQNPATIHVQ
jgi:C-terminal processing protease CtpA/Prc